MNIKVETKKLDRLGFEFDIKLAKKDFKNKYNNRLNYYKNNIDLKGFRKGKVPQKIVEKRFGDQIKEEIANDLLPQIVQEAFKQKDFTPAGEPKVEDFDINETLKLKLVAYSEPQIEDLDLEGIEADYDVEEVEKEEVKEKIDQLLERKVEYKEIDDEEKEIEEGDFVNIDFEGYLKETDEKIEGGSAEGQLIEVGKNSFLEDLEKALIGMKKNDEDTVNVKFPEDYNAENLAGKQTYFKVKINKIVEKVYPELTDELVQEISEYENVEELKEKTKEELKNTKEEKAKNELREEVFDRVLEKNNDFELPGNVYDEEIDNYMENNEDADKKEAKKKVEKSLKSYYLLRNVAGKYDINASDEVDKYIEQYAQYFGGDKKKATEMLKENGMLEQIAYSTWEKKVIDKMIDLINNKDEKENKKEEEKKETKETNTEDSKEDSDE
ncbi:MAG: trigger factor [Candidatus Mcinerneyibacterium aminivorans]|uniref:Trigger factor n=1 Tax=Candidatus Mcinerneyibacterium aminivorans TaxID=2703815 RepID=A0A5D0ME41_9BACT|nr:MAG: trigger factor [Candidatus Mcinerneyibacterium aminivorans]